MPFDALTTAAIADELRRSTEGGRIQRIIQPSASSVALSVYAHGEERWLLLSADAQRARVHRSTTKLAKAFATPSAFVMLLRKYLEGAKLEVISQVPRERIVDFQCISRNGTVRLVAEIMGKHSNVVLVSESDSVLGALKIVPPHQSSVRPIQPGRPYALPPRPLRDADIYTAGPRLDPHEHGDEAFRLMEHAPQSVTVRAALMGLFEGASPFLVDQIVLRAETLPSLAVGEADLARLLEEAGTLYRLYRTRAWTPCTFVTAKGRLDFAPFRAVDVIDLVPASTMSDAVERCLGANESRDALRSTRQDLQNRIDRSLRAAEGKLTSLQQGLSASADADVVMQRGQLVLAYQHAILAGSDRLEIPDLETTIPLDPTVSASQNAERLFRRYKKLRGARERLPGMIRKAQETRDFLRDLGAFAGIASTEADLAAVRREIEGGDIGRTHGRVKQHKPAGPIRYVLGGWTAQAGRSARENDELTFRLARRQDLWFHVRERIGAHVVLSTGGRDAPDHVLEATAQLAAYLSEGRSDTNADVDVTEVRHVRRIPGASPGRVTYSSFRTLRVQPGLGDWTRQAKR